MATAARADAEEQGRIAAERFRRDHALGQQPLGDLVAIIEQTVQVDVAVLEVDPDEHGLTMRDPLRGVVFIAVACTENPMRQRSTLAHELGHVVFQDWADPGSPEWGEHNFAEERARAFARHLLVPLDGLRALVGEPGDVAEIVLSTVVQRFVVSPPIAAIALRQAGHIGVDRERRWRELDTPYLATRFGWSDQYRALQADSRQHRAPQRLLARAIRGYVDGVVSAQTIATLQRISLDEADAGLRAAGLTPVERAVAWADPDALPEVAVDLDELDADLAGVDEPGRAAGENHAG